MKFFITTIDEIYKTASISVFKFVTCSNTVSRERGRERQPLKLDEMNHISNEVIGMVPKRKYLLN